MEEFENRANGYALLDTSEERERCISISLGGCFVLMRNSERVADLQEYINFCRQINDSSAPFVGFDTEKDVISPNIPQ